MPLDVVQATNGPTNADRLAAVRELGDIDRAIDEWRGKRKAAVKRWKGVGITAKTLAVAKRDAGMDADDVMAEIRERVLFNALRGTIELAKYGKTGDFLADLDTHVPEAARAEDEMWLTGDDGYKAGKSGVPTEDCPFLGGSERHAVWMRSWHDGQAAIAGELGDNASLADASRARPERTEDAEADNVVSIDAAGGLSPGRPSPKGAGKGKGKKGNKEKGGKGKSAPGKSGGSRKAANGNGHEAPLQLTDDRPAGKKRGRPSNAEIAARKAAAEEAGRGDLVTD